MSTSDPYRTVQETDREHSLRVENETLRTHINKLTTIKRTKRIMKLKKALPFGFPAVAIMLIGVFFERMSAGLIVCNITAAVFITVGLSVNAIYDDNAGG